MLLQANNKTVLTSHLRTITMCANLVETTLIHFAISVRILNNVTNAITDFILLIGFVSHVRKGTITVLIVTQLHVCNALQELIGIRI